MHIERVGLRHFRNHLATEIELDPQITLVTGPNGHGKTNLLEAIDLLSGRRSFRGAHTADLINVGGVAGRVAHGAVSSTAGIGTAGGRAAVEAVVIGGGESYERRLEVTMSFDSGAATKATINRNNVPRLSDLAEVLQTVVFTPGDLELVQGSPGTRRQLLDDVAGAISRDYRTARQQLDRVLRQRNALLKQSRHRFDEDAERTLAVWDSQLVQCSETLGEHRAQTIMQLQPTADQYYAKLAADAAAAPPAAGLALSYHAPWRADGMAAALEQSQQEDLRRGVTTVGPHRDDLVVTLNSLPAGTHCSQGEQRCLALSFRLAQHCLLTEALADAPVVLLDDVFSELDTQRAENLIHCLPQCQVVVTSATGSLPSNASVAKHIELLNGQVHDRRS